MDYIYYCGGAGYIILGSITGADPYWGTIGGIAGIVIGDALWLIRVRREMAV
jgi:hypothetical protein